MKLKRAPEDFKVDEVARWDNDPRGAFGIYKLKKRKITTFEAVRLVAARTGVPLDRIAYIGLKDRQAVTSQFVSIEGPLVTVPVQGIRLEPVGRAAAPLTAKNLLGNDFTLVVRDLAEDEARAFPQKIAAIAKHGVVNYFDDQRFGSLKGGQGFPAKDLVLGNPEEALKKLIATPTPLDPIPEKNFKVLLKKTWGDWESIARKFGTRRGATMVRHLRKKPGDFHGAFQRCPAKERAIHVFAYQSFIWNHSVARFLEAVLPRERLVIAGTIAGRILFPDLRQDEPAPDLPATFPLVAHDSVIADPRVAAAVKAALASEGLTLERFKIDGIPGCFFKHEERDLFLKPERLHVSAGPYHDDQHPGRWALTVSFRLPPGGYATLVMKRLLEARPLGPAPVPHGAGGARRHGHGHGRAPGPPRHHGGGGPPRHHGGGGPSPHHRGDGPPRHHQGGGPPQHRGGGGPSPHHRGDGPPRHRQGGGPPRHHGGGGPQRPGPRGPRREGRGPR